MVRVGSPGGPQAPGEAQEEGAQIIEVRSKEVCLHSGGPSPSVLKLGGVAAVGLPG